MTPSFTPGPWTYDGEYITVDAHVIAQPTWVDGKSEDANARLIAAAPEMYELLADRHVGGNVWEDRINDLFRRIAGKV